MSKYKSKIRVFQSVSKFKHVTPPKDSFKSGEKQPTNPGHLTELRVVDLCCRQELEVITRILNLMLNWRVNH